MSYTQAQRMCRVHSPLGDDALLLTRMRADEGLSRVFTFELELLSERADVSGEALVGAPLAVSLQLRSGAQRWFHGLCARFEEGPAVGRFAAYRALLVPWFALLQRRSGQRIFQHRSVPEIARVLFGELGFADFKFELIGSYPPLEYCVQYAESDFDFVSRLFEHAGIAYSFEHGPQAHTLVAFDSSAAAAPCPGQPQAVYASASGMGAAGDLRELRFERELRPGAYALGDYSFEQPQLSLHSSTTSIGCAGTSARLEVYEWPAGHRDPAGGEALARRRIEIEECAAVRGRAQSECPAFAPGYRFELLGHLRPEYNAAQLITDVCHRVTESVGDAVHGHASYSNSLTLIPHAVAYRPPRRTPRPIARTQTATVVGAPGQEIDVDRHGRVIVQFHWDREGRRDARSSCRVRVAQSWAGRGWGAIAHPRVGQEVVVEFINGDPDRPLVTGRVHNAEQTPPYPLPEQASCSGIKTRSTPGGSASQFSELRFEDKQGAELLYIQAQRDRSTLTKGDDAQRVGGDRSRSVGRDESVQIGRDAVREVGGASRESVGGEKRTAVGTSWSAQAAESIELVSGAARLTLSSSGEIELTGREITLRTAGGIIHIDAAGRITIRGSQVTIDPPPP